MVDAGRVIAFIWLCVCLVQFLADAIFNHVGIWIQLLNIGKRLLRSAQSIGKLPPQQQADLFERRLENLLQIERIHRWHLACQMVIAPASMLMLANLATRGLIQAAVGVRPLDWHEALGSSFPTAWYVVTGSQITRLLHGRVNLQTHSAMITSIHLGFLAICALSVGINASSRFDYAFSYSWTLLSRVFASMMDGSLTNGFLTCVTFNIWSVLCRVMLLHDLRIIDIFLEIFSTTLICGMLWFYKVIRRELVKSTLEAKESRNFKDAGVSLLLKTCDAVVQLSEDFRITDPAPSLSALLLRQSSMEGLCFVDLILQADAVQRFLNFMGGANYADDELILPLRDSGGCAVNVRVMHAQGLDSHDQLFHILGIQEVSPLQLDTVPQAYVPSQRGSKPLGDIDAVSESSSLDLLVETRSVCSDTVHIDFRTEDMSVLLELGDDDCLKIISCSAALSSVLGLINASAHLFERLCPLDAPAFLLWIHDCLSEGRPKVRRLSFRLPGTNRELRAVVLMVPISKDIKDAGQDQDCTAGVPEEERPDVILFRLELVETKFKKPSKSGAASSIAQASQPQDVARPGAKAKEEDRVGWLEEVEEVRSGPRLPCVIGRSLASL